MLRKILLGAAVAAVAVLSVYAQQGPFNDLPNPYQTVENYFQLGRPWGSTSAVDIDRDGRSIWVGERCGANTCYDAATGKMSPHNPILKFDPSGKLERSFGAGMVVFAHGIHVDRDGNVWITDANGNTGGGGGRAGQKPAAKPEKPVGHQVLKFSPDGKLLMAMGKPGVEGNPPDALTEPNDVVTAPNGDIFVAEGHSGQGANAAPDTVARISKFTRDGKFVKSWGKLGSGPGEFRTPHGLALDDAGRLIVADRGNVRIQVFDQDGKFLQETKAFSRLSGIYVRNGVLYGADSESSQTSNPGWRRGIRMGPLKDLKPTFFIPDVAHTDLQKAPGGTSNAEGVAVDAQGNIYGAEVGPRAVKKYIKK
jgi:sugar lactone lactonase YvrE